LDRIVFYVLDVRIARIIRGPGLGADEKTQKKAQKKAQEKTSAHRHPTGTPPELRLPAAGQGLEAVETVA
jgi:hypothetical protein